MRPLILRILPLVVLMTLLVGGAAAQVIKIEPNSFDFGDMKQQEDRVTYVAVSNMGAGLLVIEDVKADCGCTVPNIENKSLGPGESTQVEIRFNSKKFHGNVFKSVQIISNDPQNPVVDIMLTANVFSPLVITPTTERIGFSRSQRGEVITKLVTFEATQVENLELSVDKTRGDLFEVKTVNGVDGDPRKSIIEVTVPANMVPGRHRDVVRVSTNVPERATVDIEMQAWIVEELTTSPEQVSFRYKKTFNQTVRVAPFKKGLTFKVTGAEIDLPEVELEVIEAIPNAEIKVRMTGHPISKDDPRAIETNGRIKGTLRIFTDLKNTPEIIVPVTYMVRM